MSRTISWVRYKNFSGLIIRGDQQIFLSEADKAKHLYRAFYMVVQLESGKWGTVQSYDGCGISGGPFHWIANFPSTGEQGPLFSLLRTIEVSVPDNNVNIAALLEAFKRAGCFLAKDGKLRGTNGGSILTGRQIRNMVAPVNGVVPETGPNRTVADKWATLFHNLFSDPSTYKAQTEYALSYLVHGYAELERKAYETMFRSTIETIEAIVVPDISALADPIGFLSIDLAMCFYHSASVNAPGLAAKCLSEVLMETKNPALLPGAIIHKLGTQNYGKWRDTIDGDNRYDGFRIKAKQTGLWPEALFNTIMPLNFV